MSKRDFAVFMPLAYALWKKIAATVSAVCLYISMPVLPAAAADSGFAGSVSCRECHEKFYQLWASSRHGKAMQPYTPEFAKAELTPQKEDVVIKKSRFRADLTNGLVVENGPAGTKRYALEQVLGGKNVYYFLTTRERGRLQTLPLAYDVNKKEWLDTAASGLRHIPGEQPGHPVDWTDPAYTFNTSCYGCHVSQLSTNYDPKTDTYRTRWSEPGINCETCHGAAAEHNRIAKSTPKGQPLPELRIIRTKTMTREQRNDLCSSCHAKASPLTIEYKPEERLFDHFDLATFEDPDFYPDGRDLGENYTLTSWRMSPCAMSGKLDCMHCHTSSGRYRFKKEKFNDACMPCHDDKVKNPSEHTRHPAESTGSRCVSCHMPMTSFARMNRSDHSMRPPTPAATIAYKSPNACNICHTDKDAAWADTYVRKWRMRDYQAPLLRRAALVEAARRRDWSKLPEMLAYIQSKDRDEIITVSLIRLISIVQDPKVIPAMLSAVKDQSPLVRASAVQALGLLPTPESLQALIQATADEYRLVRVRAAAGIAAFPKMIAPPAYLVQIRKANDEYLASLTARPDQWTSQYNLGNYHLGRGEQANAVAAYETALKLDPQAVMPRVNMSIAYAQMKEYDKGEKALQEALALVPESAVANFNMGLLKAERNDLKTAERHLEKAFSADPQMAQAAYNLCIITARDRINDAVAWCRKASDLRPQEPRYTYTLAFYLNQKGDRDEAISILKALLEKYPKYGDAEKLLQDIAGK